MYSEIIKGIIPPLVTPLKNNLDLDIEALNRLIEHVAAGGVSGVFLLGSCGENASLTNDKKKVIEDFINEFEQFNIESTPKS